MLCMYICVIVFSNFMNDHLTSFMPDKKKGAIAIYEIPTLITSRGGWSLVAECLSVRLIIVQAWWALVGS